MLASSLRSLLQEARLARMGWVLEALDYVEARRTHRQAGLAPA
jgi:hypothetical protein